jgi:hypothetical protein
MNDCGDDSEESVGRAVDALLEEGVSEETVLEEFVEPLSGWIEKLVARAKSDIDSACRYHGYDQVNLELKLNRLMETDSIIDTLTIDFRPDEYDTEEQRLIQHREEAFERHPEQKGLVVFPQQIAELRFELPKVWSLGCAVLYYKSDDLVVRRMYCEPDAVLQAMIEIYLKTILPFEAAGRKVSVTNMHYFTKPSFNREGKFFYFDRIGDVDSCVGLSFHGRLKNEVPECPRTYHTDHDGSRLWKNYFKYAYSGQ